MANLLNIASTGLNVSRKALETDSHNIANVNTEGYSRQRVNQQSNEPHARNGLIQGTGAKITSITRAHDASIEKRFRASLSDHGYDSNRAMQLEQVENMFHEIDKDGLNKILNKFYNSFRDLANQPENETVRSVVRDNAQIVIRDFNRIRGSLDKLARNIDSKLVGEIEDINSTLEDVTILNKKIRTLEALGDESGDLRDQRDLAVQELAKSFKVHTYEDKQGNYVVLAKNVGTLVTGAHYQELAVGGTTKSKSSNNMDGSTEIYIKDRPNHPITDKFLKGRIKALGEARNEDIRNLQDHIDLIAFNFSKSVNAVHRNGYVSREIQVDEQGNPVSQDEKGQTTGINFFTEIDSVHGAAEKLDLSKEVKESLTNITTGISPNSPGDNRVALAISKLQHEKIMDEGRATLEEFYLESIGKIGLQAGKANLNLEQSEGLLAQVKNIKERLSGVSLDEETANLIRHQHAYEASAKVMQTANEMFSTVLNIKR